MSAWPPLSSLFTTALAVVLAIAGVRLTAQSPQLGQFRGDWVPQSAACTTAVRFRVDEKTMTLINGKDSQTWGNVATPSAFFGPDYRGISVVALPDFDGAQVINFYARISRGGGRGRDRGRTESERVPGALAVGGSSRGLAQIGFATGLTPLPTKGSVHGNLTELIVVSTTLEFP
jgi:hypothetical protein